MIRTLTLFAFLILLSLPTLAEEPKGLHMFVAAGNNLAIPGSIRVGWNQWEAGMIGGGVYGFGKRFFIKNKYYTQFGFAIAGAGDVGFGPWGAIGFDTKLFWKIGLRGEVLGVMVHTGYSRARGNLGLSIDF